MSNRNEKQDNLTALATTRMTRRNLLGTAGQGFLGMALFSLLGGSAANAAGKTPLERMLPGAKELAAKPTMGGVDGDGQDTALALPTRLTMLQWGDGAKFDQPEYYETIAFGDMDGDGQDELMIRTPGGVAVERFEPSLGQWLPLANNGPMFTDATGWNQPQYYRTIQCTDVDGEGQDEIVARTPTGMQAYKFNSASRQFSALPLGDFFGDSHDGGIWTQEAHYATIKWGKLRSPGYGLQWVIGRDTYGIIAHYFAEETNSWWLPYDGHGPWADNDSETGTNWTLPQYYETIQIADIDGDGQEELLGRSASGIQVYKFNAGNGQWQKMYGGTPSSPSILSDSSGWSAPQYYTTIQCADIDGDGKYELLGRGFAGIYVYKWDAGSSSFIQHSLLEEWTDASGGINPIYYATIQCGDVDGDGAAEIVGRSWQGMATFKYSEGWQNIAFNLPGWTDDGTDGNGNAVADSNGTKWDEVQYYSTIKLVRTHADTRALLANPNCRGGASRPYATLIGRDKYGIQTWRYVGASWWVPTSAPMPDLSSDPDYVAGMTYLTNYWGLSFGDIRWHYNQSTFTNFSTYYTALYNTAPGTYFSTPSTPTMTKPATVSDPAKWQAMCWQLYWEIRACEKVYDWYGTLTSNLIRDLGAADMATLTSVGQYLSIPINSANAGGALSFATLMANSAWAFLGWGELDMSAASMIAGLIASGLSYCSSGTNNDGPTFQGTYGDMIARLSNATTDQQTLNGAMHSAMTGGANETNGVYVPFAGDFGMLGAAGSCIESGAWYWPVDNLNNPTNADIVKLSQQTKALAFWQGLVLVSNWTNAVNGYTGHPEHYPSEYVYSDYPNGPKGAIDWYIGASSSDSSAYPAKQSMDELFQPKVAGQTFPLGVPLADLFTGNDQWPNLPFHNFTPHRETVVAAQPLPVAPTPNIALGEMTREANGEVIVTVKVTNRALEAGTNVEFASATLSNRSALVPLPRHRTRLAPGTSFTARLRFPATAGTSGQTVALKIQGKHKTGTFGGSYRVKLP